MPPRRLAQTCRYTDGCGSSPWLCFESSTRCHWPGGCGGVRTRRGKASMATRRRLTGAAAGTADLESRSPYRVPHFGRGRRRRLLLRLLARPWRRALVSGASGRRPEPYRATLALAPSSKALFTSPVVSAVRANWVVACARRPVAVGRLILSAGVGHCRPDMPAAAGRWHVLPGGGWPERKCPLRRWERFSSDVELSRLSLALGRPQPGTFRR